jgi:DNA-binding transcriptional ArsR family regulator
MHAAYVLHFMVMADQFEMELQGLVTKVAHDLAQDITRLILRRLGIEGSASRTSGNKARSAPAGAVSKTLRQASKSRPKRMGTPAGKAKGRPAPPRARTSSEERAAIIEKIAGVVERSDGLSVGEIERASGLSRAAVASALKLLKEQGRAFMGGTKRFARYASTQAAADQASLDARGGAS